MTLYIWAQIVGLTGYLFYIRAPSFQHREDILKHEGSACLILALQWALLNQPSLVITNTLIGLAALTALSALSQNRKNTLLALIYAAAFMAFAESWENTTIDYLAASSLMLHITAKRFNDLVKLRLCGIGGGSLLVIAGTLAASCPAMIFNVLFVAGHIRKLAELQSASPSVPGIHPAIKNT